MIQKISNSELFICFSFNTIIFNFSFFLSQAKTQFSFSLHCTLAFGSLVPPTDSGLSEATPQTQPRLLCESLINRRWHHRFQRDATMASGWGITGNKGRCYDFWVDFSECMSRCREPKDCSLLREDYLECLHHSKEVISFSQLCFQFHFLLLRSVYNQPSIASSMSAPICFYSYFYFFKVIWLY